MQQEKVYLKTQSSGKDKTNILSATLWTFRRVGHGVGQAVFCKLMEQKLSVYPGRERAFLTKLTVNYCKNQLAAAKRFVPDALDDLILPAEPADRTLYRAVMELPEKYRVVIVLHCMEGYALSEIAGFLHITTSAVSMRLHRARKMLDEQLGRD